MRTKTKTTKKVTTLKKPEYQYEWYKTLAENYQLPTNQLASILPFVKIGTIRRYKNFLSHYANGNTYLTRSMPSELKKAYLSVRSNRSQKPSKKIKKIWNIKCSFIGKEGTFFTSKEYKSKNSVLSAVTKALKNKSFKDFQITYKES